jgi:hypothetical protein
MKNPSLSNQTMQQSSFTILQSLKNDITGNTGTLRSTRWLQSNRILQVHKSNSDQRDRSLIKSFERPFFFFRGRMHFCFDVLILLLRRRSRICLWISASSIEMIAVYYTLPCNKTKNGIIEYLRYSYF